jgi:hypothetical protein
MPPGLAAQLATNDRDRLQPARVQLGLKDPRASTRAGLYTRLGAKAAAYNSIIFVNHLTGRPPFTPL